MDKQKINLDQLYRERFQNYEMEPSSGAATSLMQKLKIAKTISVVKWMAGAILITTTAITIGFLSFPSDDTEKQTQNIENETIINTNEAVKIITESNIETNESGYSKNHSTKQTTEQQILLPDQLNTSDNQKEIKVNKQQENTILKREESDSKSALLITETIFTIEEQTANEKGLEEVGYNKETDYVSQDQLEYRNCVLDVSRPAPLFSKSNMQLKSYNRFEGQESAKTKTKKVKSINDPLSPATSKGASKLNGYFDFHFAPMLWQNKANLASPEMDSTRTYSLNHKPKLSYEFGVSFQLHHQNIPIFLQLGLDYQILKEQIDFQFSRSFEDPDLSYWTYDSLWEYHQVLDTFYIIIEENHFIIDSIFTTDTILIQIDSSYYPVISKEERSLNHLNTYRYLNIPLLLGYEFESKNKKWNYQILAGPTISINLQNEGYYYTKMGEFEEYSGKVTPSLMWNFYAAANFGYRWKKWLFYVQPEFQYQFNQSELIHQIPKRKYQFYKLKFGIRLQLF